MLLSQDCYADRAIEEELNNVEGMVVLWQDIWILESLDKNQRWQPCELPKACQMQGLKVFFTGEVMRIFPGERRVATPLQLKSIHIPNK